MEQRIKRYNMMKHPTNIRIKGQNTLNWKAVLLLKLKVTRTERNINILVTVVRVITALGKISTSLMKRFMGISKRLNHQVLMAKQKKERKLKHGYPE